MAERHFEFLIIGGGTAGITVASRILRRVPRASLAVVEPSDKHFYQPLWTLVGGGEVDKQETVRPEAEVMPPGATWVRARARKVDPEARTVETDDGQTLRYDYLVVAAGLRILWDQVKGLRETIGKNGVCTNFDYHYVDSTWKFLQEFEEGNAIFTFPNTETKCGGAPQKIMWLADHYFRETRKRDRATIYFATPRPTFFGVSYYAEPLLRLVKERDIHPLYRHNLVEVRGERKEAVFEQLDTGETVVLPFAFLHVTPPQGPHGFLQNSPLADADGWVDLDPHTLQHVRYPNVFGLGDCSNLPTSKTGAAVRKQAPVLVDNLLAFRAGESPLPARYDGYTSCPLITGYGRLILAEFDYAGRPRETFPIDQRKERYSMYLLKRYILPWMYWNLMLKGYA